MARTHKVGRRKFRSRQQNKAEKAARREQEVLTLRLTLQAQIDELLSEIAAWGDDRRKVAACFEPAVHTVPVAIFH